MKALISPDENFRVVEVTNLEFPVASPLYFVECPPNCTPEWTYDGITFKEPRPLPVLTPQTVSPYQAREALRQAGLLSQVESAIAAGGEADKIKWEYATEVNRSDALVANMALALGLTEQQLDELFILAASL